LYRPSRLGKCRDRIGQEGDLRLAWELLRAATDVGPRDRTARNGPPRLHALQYDRRDRPNPRSRPLDCSLRSGRCPNGLGMK
jgi:hypothetical protein